MVQEIENRLVLAAVVAFNDQSGVTSFLGNQGFAATPAGAQVVADGGLNIAYANVLILRPAELPASRNNMIVQAGFIMDPTAPPTAQLEYQIAGPAGFTAPLGAAVQAAGQPGDIAIGLPAIGGAGDAQISVMVTQITPAD